MVKYAIKMYTGSVITGDSVAQIIIPQTAMLVSVSWDFLGIIGAGAVGAAQWYQLATQSTAQVTLNDSRNIIDEFSPYGANGANFNTSTNKVTPIPGIKFQAGDKIYLHTYSYVAWATARCSANLLFA